MVSSLDERLDAYLSPFVDSRDFSGVVILARGEEETMRAYGFANVDHPLIPIDDDRYFLRLKFAEVAFRPGGPDPSLEWSQDGQTYTLRRIGAA